MAIHRLSLPGIVANDASSSARQAASVTELNDRAREVLRLVVESYVETGDPVGSRALTRKITETLSPATIRNIMADLEEMGYVASPHTSAGRIPTPRGYRIFVDTLLTVQQIDEIGRAHV